MHADNAYWSDNVYAQADLSLRWAHMSESTFSQVVIHTLRKHAYSDMLKILAPTK